MGLWSATSTTLCVVPALKTTHQGSGACDRRGAHRGHGYPGGRPRVGGERIHYQFETVHPFYDGNGRVGRLLLALMLQNWCGLTKPWLYMSAFFDRYKEEYISHLFDVSARGDWDSWLAFCLDGTVVQAVDTIERCQKLLNLREDYHSRVLETKGKVRLGRIVEDLFAVPFTQIPRLAKRFDVTYPTAKSDVEMLLEKNILSELRDMPTRTFIAHEIFAVAFDEPRR